MEQTRAKFIKSLLIGATSVPVIMQACKKDSVASGTSSTSDSTSTGTGSTGTCIVTPTETEGPFPYPGGELTNPLERADVTEGQTGIPISYIFTIVIRIAVAQLYRAPASISGIVIKTDIIPDTITRTEVFQGLQRIMQDKHFLEGISLLTAMDKRNSLPYTRVGTRRELPMCILKFT